MLALDGRLTDREGLRIALGGDGDSGDAGLIGAALLRWGDDALLRLHGQFAFAWWDGAEKRLLLACDRSGGRTLFFHRSDNDQRLRFCSVIGALFADRSVPRRVDPHAVARAGFKLDFASGRTCFLDIEQIGAAEKLVMTPDGVRVNRYWRLDLHRKIRLPCDSDYVDAARELLDRVTLEHLPKDGPVIAMMSGGLDSTAVAATAARLTTPAKVLTLTVRPDPTAAQTALGRNGFADEWDLAQDVARLHPNMRAEAVSARLDGVEDLMRRDMPWTGRPAVHLLAGLWFDPLWRRARALGARGVLGGRSGNITLSTSAVSTLIRPSTLADAPGALANGLAQFCRNPGVPSAAAALRGLPPVWAAQWLRRLIGRPSMREARTGLSANAAEMIGVETLWREMQNGDESAPFRCRGRLIYMEKTWKGAAIYSPLRFARGVEYFDPLGDVRLAEFCFALPDDQFFRKGIDRFLARRVLADRLPESILKDRRKGRQNAEWFDWMTRLRPWLAAELDSLDNSPLGRELVDGPRLRAILDNWPVDADAAHPRYFELMDALGGGVVLGVFLRWAEGRNA